MENALYINSYREGYGIDQIKTTMTVGELINHLEGFDEDSPVYLRHDNGYTYGGITPRCFIDSEADGASDWY